ncbi:DUF3429 domain-containing protein [Shewanella psychrotolerans]|uniref:DUF3429 domain-containing protein n=1 Tax=Shewanella psychrotolerans TaxID=2864206 RepID=UPI001C657963|nr:DUF3429 domain-containing protein [Shewanella psychrotolerans]QYK00816.1 DUF3429 domain-containing protein [Shewanella psychrotolerans]
MSKTYSMLGYAGLLPFIISTCLILMGQTLFSIDPFTLFITYSAIILSFLAGTLWGRESSKVHYLNDDKLLIISNVVSVLAWVTIVINHLYASLIILMLGYVVVYRLDKQQWRDKTLSDEYIQLRTYLTGVALVCHVIVLGVGN